MTRMRCGACQAKLPSTGRFCPECAAPRVIDADATATITTHSHRTPVSHHSSEDGRFPPGSLFADRYRIISLAGRGGMGEVYRATDIKLNQPVALKFLPHEIADRPGLLERFHGEVRIARQVSHANVCRVYDIGEAEGQAFISMEYVDGEDLGSLLRRIGRLPENKALEIARKLCAGLGAAHSKGVLHRDLKPANVMIDGRGNVVIMDFGLAAIADQVSGAEVRNGTPAYMAPEQLAGREVSERSDVYALGLVLYEVFTGHRAFETADRTEVPNASTVVRDLDPAIERVIARCLDSNPAKRPASAYAVARMLPGGDPLAEALAAGDTPTPAMVAASEEIGALPVWAVAASYALVLIGLAIAVLIGGRNQITSRTPLPYSPEILTQKAKDVAAKLGYSATPVDWEQGFTPTEFARWAPRNLPEADYNKYFQLGRPAPIAFRYEQSTQDLRSQPVPDMFALRRPEPSQELVKLSLDPQGRLLDLEASPKIAVPNEGAAVSWIPLFESAGLNAQQWKEVAPEQVPSVPFDSRIAWTGTFPEAPGIPVRIEAAAWHGQPVAFHFSGPWSNAPSGPRPGGGPPGTFNPVLLVFVAALIMGIQNVRRGRSDTRGAIRLGLFVMLCAFVAGVLNSQHYFDSRNLTTQLGQAVILGCLGSATYLALEPYVRRYWPQSLISWTRLLSGDLQNPVSAGHILIGMAAAAFNRLIFMAMEIGVDRQPQIGELRLLYPVQLIAHWFDAAAQPVLIALVLFFVLFLIRVVLRTTLLSAIGMLVLIAGFNLTRGMLPPGLFLISIPDIVLMVLALNFGVVPLAVNFVFLQNEMIYSPQWGSWQATSGMLHVTLILAVSTWALRTALAGRRIVSREILPN